MHDFVYTKYVRTYVRIIYTVTHLHSGTLLFIIYVHVHPMHLYTHTHSI